MEKLVAQYPWGFVAAVVVAIAVLGWAITHPDGPNWKKKDKQ